MIAVLCAVLTALVAGLGSLVAHTALRRLRARQALREAWKAGIEESYARDVEIYAPLRVPALSDRGPVIYVVAGSLQNARTYVRLTGEDPRWFRILAEPSRVRGLAPGSPVVMLLDDYKPGRMREFGEWLVICGANVRYADLDQMTGARR